MSAPTQDINGMFISVHVRDGANWRVQSGHAGALVTLDYSTVTLNFSSLDEVIALAETLRSQAHRLGPGGVGLS